MSAENTKRRRLGRGLSALLGEDIAAEAAPLAEPVPVEFLEPGGFQPRQHFDEDSLQALVLSIKDKGILQPLLVRRREDAPERYEIIAGERRWRAAQLAQLHVVPCIVKALSDAEALEIALVENLQRQDLSPLEEAEAFRRLMEEFAHTQETLSRVVGKSRSHVANTMRLLGLPEPVKRLVQDGALTAGHARALLNAPEPEQLARLVVSRQLNVRQTEALAQGRSHSPVATATRREKDPDTLALERQIAEALGLKVTITARGAAGELTIHYRTLDQLDEVLRRLTPDTVA